MLELRQQYPLAGLLQLAGLARSTFYYQQKALQRGDKYVGLKAKTRELFERHKGRYDYRRITDDRIKLKLDGLSPVEYRLRFA